MFLTIEKKYNPYFNKKSKEPVATKPVEEKEDKKKGSKGYWKGVAKTAGLGGLISAGIVGKAMNNRNHVARQAGEVVPYNLKSYLKNLGRNAAVGAGALGLLGSMALNKETKHDTEEQTRTKRYSRLTGYGGSALGLGTIGLHSAGIIKGNKLGFYAPLAAIAASPVIGATVGSIRNKYLQRKNKTENK